LTIVLFVGLVVYNIISNKKVQKRKMGGKAWKESINLF
jgi:hypothetical protein